MKLCLTGMLMLCSVRPSLTLTYTLFLIFCHIWYSCTGQGLSAEDCYHSHECTLLGVAEASGGATEQERPPSSPCPVILLISALSEFCGPSALPSL